MPITPKTGSLLHAETQVTDRAPEEDQDREFMSLPPRKAQSKSSLSGKSWNSRYSLRRQPRRHSLWFGNIRMGRFGRKRRLSARICCSVFSGYCTLRGRNASCEGVGPPACRT
jgi:hypothetical protein